MCTQTLIADAIFRKKKLLCKQYTYKYLEYFFPSCTQVNTPKNCNITRKLRGSNTQNLSKYMPLIIGSGYYFQL